MTRKKTKSNGKEYVYFICTTNKQNKHECNPHRIKEQDVYDAALAVIQAQVSLALDLERALHEVNGISWERRELERIQNRIARQEDVIEYNKKMKAGIYEDFKTEMITLEEYKISKQTAIRKSKKPRMRLPVLPATEIQSMRGLPVSRAGWHSSRNMRTSMS